MKEWLQRMRLPAAVFIFAWAVCATIAAAAAFAVVHRTQSENRLLQDQIARRDRTDFMIELDACAQDLLATRALLSDRLDWMARDHLDALRTFGDEITANEAEAFDFHRFHQRKVWERESQRINVDLARRGVPLLSAY